MFDPPQSHRVPKTSMLSCSKLYIAHFNLPNKNSSVTPSRSCLYLGLCWNKSWWPPTQTLSLLICQVRGSAEAPRALCLVPARCDTSDGLATPECLAGFWLSLLCLLFLPMSHLCWSLVRWGHGVNNLATDWATFMSSQEARPAWHTSQVLSIFLPHFLCSSLR